jgi:hypothetical protein
MLFLCWLLWSVSVRGARLVMDCGCGSLMCFVLYNSHLPLASALFLLFCWNPSIPHMRCSPGHSHHGHLDQSHPFVRLCHCCLVRGRLRGSLDLPLDFLGMTCCLTGFFFFFFFFSSRLCALHCGHRGKVFVRPTTRHRTTLFDVRGWVWQSMYYDFPLNNNNYKMQD